MEELERAVLTVMSRVFSHRKLYERNEEAVKQHLIGEIFKALGWNWSNPEEVRPEERTEDGRADYALLLNGEIVAFVEAKNLGVNVLSKDEPLRQLARYCFSRGVKYGVLTNGVAWVVVRAFAEGTSLRERILFTVDLENDPVERSVVKLSLLAKSRIKDVERLSSLLRALEVSFLELLREYPQNLIVDFLLAGHSLIPVSKLSPEVSPKAVYVHENGWKPLPLGDRSLKGALLAVLDYLEARSKGEKKEEVKRVRELLSVLSLPPEKALMILKGIEEEENLKIAFEI
ncbi:type I restriction endonuclease [Thermococcus sp.]|uniref:type I restriction endonuclease n=1 Tax=Thermococcus sp. TaxID=35749 RepID=UPI00260BC531|nr:type I restriction endonuclease [Thermococcus sp.]